MDFLDKALALVSLSPQLLGIGAIVLETLFRLFPTQKPLSIAHVVAGVVGKVGALLTGLANALDKVLPQKTVE